MDSSCPSRDQLLAYLLGTLPEAQAGELEQHVGDCRLCEEILQGMEGFSDTMIAALRQRQLSGQDEGNIHPVAPPISEESEMLPSIGESNADSLETRSVLETAGAGIQHAHPRQIGRYRVERLLGEGGFGRVYLARDEQLQRDVAIKVPHARLVTRVEDAQSYLAEAQTLANLDHPHIVPVHDVGSTADYPCYFVSKYIEGTSLSHRLKQRGFSHEEAARLVATLAKALHYAHTKGIVHRDVKPGNILLGHGSTPFLVDFGLALRESELGKGPVYAGTPAYMSPEQARGEGHRVDGRSDIYSLGSVFYELLTGRRTFLATEALELIELAANQEPKPPRQIDDRIPKELERICLKAISKRASDRYTTAKDMAEDLEHHLAAQAIAPAPAAASVGRTIPTGSDSTGPLADLETAGSDTRPIRIVPKGLRSFDAHDADFFLELLPGPRDRD